MNIVHFIINIWQQYWTDIILVLAFMAVLILLWKQGKKDLVQKIITELVCKAEKEFGSGTGPIKLAAVWSGIYDRLPFVVRLLFTKDELQSYIEEIVTWLKKKLAENSGFLLNYSEEKILSK